MLKLAFAALIALAAVSAACGSGSGTKTSTPNSGACGGAAPATAASSCGGDTPAPEPTGARPALLTAASFAGIPQDGLTLGKADAPLTIDLYQNFLCPHCQEFAVTMLAQLINDYVANGKVAVAFHDVALGSDAATLAHESAHCAADEGKFWPAYAALYQNFSPDQSAYMIANIESFLAPTGVDATKLDACLQSGKYKMAVEASTAAFNALPDTKPAYADALATATASQGPFIPLLDIGGTVVVAPDSYAQVTAAIDAALAP